MASGSAAPWRQFTFFDKEPVVDADDNAKPPAWLQNMDITASTGGRGSLFFGDSKGNVLLINHRLSTVFTFAAHPGPVTHMKMMKHRNILLTIGEDELGIPVVKVWNLDKMDKAAQAPVLSRSSKIQHNNKVFPVTALAVLENMSQVAVGLENGVVLLIRGDISRDRFTKTKVVHESSELVTGLGFYEDSKSTILYVVTLAKVLLCNTSSKEVTTTLEEHGAELKCSLATPQNENQLICVGRKEAVYFYVTPEDFNRLPDEKVSLSWFKNYLVIVSYEPAKVAARAPFSEITGGPAAAAARAAVEAYENGSGETVRLGTVLTLYDLKSKFIAYSGSFGGGEWDESDFGIPGQVGRVKPPVPIKCVTSEWGQLFVTTIDNRMYRLEEKDLATKLDLLFRKNMYTLALSMVTASLGAISGLEDSKTIAEASSTSASTEYDHSTLIEIHKRYGDYLYAKGDYDAAMVQYIHTLHSLEPSYVIRKFLDAQRIHNLTSYLQSLHDAGLANEDHTTLLINCYTKLKDMARLDVFIKGGAVATSGAASAASFDVETAMRVCRQAGYHEHALWLAKRFSRHEGCLMILVEDLKRFREAVEYVSSLQARDQEEMMKGYGHVLVTEMPEMMTEVLVKLCTVPAVPARPKTSHGTEEEDEPVGVMASLSSLASRPSVATPAGIAGRISNPESFLHLYVNRPDWCVRFLEKVLEVRWGVSTGVKGKSAAHHHANAAPVEGQVFQESLKISCNTLLELLLGPTASTLLQSSKDFQSEETVGDKTPTLARANAKSSQMRKVLEESLLGSQYEREAKTLNLLRHPKAKYDLDQALIFCYLNKFKDGILYLYEKMNRHNDIMRYHMETADYAEIIETCKKFGDTDPSLWPQALSYFAERGAGSGAMDTQRELTEVLDAIDQRNLLPPLKVIEILSKNTAVTVGTVRNYIVRRMSAERQAIIEAKKLVASYKDETERMRAQIDEMRGSAIVFQASKCSLCSQALELPTVHFMCKHSYHARCLGEGGLGPSREERECPRCAPEHRMVMEMAQRMAVGGVDDDVFLAKLQFTSNELEKEAARATGKELDVEKEKLKKAIRQNNTDGAKIFASNVIRKKNEALNYLKMSSRLDGVITRVHTATKIMKVTSAMAGVVKGLDGCVSDKNLEKVTKVMDKFEKQFEELDIQTAYMESVMSGSSSLTTPAAEVELLIAQVAEENGLELQFSLPNVTGEGARLGAGNEHVRDRNHQPR
ncbi:Vacuolar protein sorting-associated protein 11 [Irineochytrium annulatum]|nr:Vacuolar protein sorting-associated protein 11 [Irineochytrium annulatum]